MTDDSPATSNSTPESLLPDLKVELGPELCGDDGGVNDEYLLMFLYWKADVKRAAQRYRDFVAWKGSDDGSIFDESLRVSTDPELERLLMSEVIIAPPNLTTNDGSPVLIGRFRNNDMTDGRTVDGVCRMLLYAIDQVLQRPETQKHGYTIVHDLRGFDKAKNARLEIAKRLFKGFLGLFPVKINAVYICAAPMVFIGFFKIVSIFMPKKLRGRIHFIDNFEQLANEHGVLDPNKLLPEMGGTLDWSTEKWIDEQKQKEQRKDFKSLTNIKSIPASTKSP